MRTIEVNGGPLDRIALHGGGWQIHSWNIAELVPGSGLAARIVREVVW